MLKQITLSLILLLFIFNIHSQTTNIFPSDGNVGIGVTNPKEKLEVNNGALTVGGPHKNFIFITSHWDKNSDRLFIAPGKNGDWNWSKQMTFKDNGDLGVSGNIGIGTTNPGAKLEINNSGLRTRLGSNDKAAISFLPNNGNSFFHISHGLQNDLVFSHGTNVGGGHLMTIRNSGDVGIGIEKPTEKLHVNGNILANGQVNLINPLNSQSSVSLNWKDNIARIRVGGEGAGASNGFHIQGPGDRSLLRVRGNGLTGIGTNSPVSKLHVYTDQSSALRFQRAGADIYGFEIGGKIFGLYNYTSKQYKMKVQGNNLTLMENDGFVGIGTTNPDGWRLAVNGKIRAKEIKVETNWADYVFEDDYALPSLQEVEAHIQQKGHLINIPSAKEVEENGIFLGEMNAKLLEKIEELTLYTIAQEKKLENLQILEAKNKDLEERLQKLEAILNN